MEFLTEEAEKARFPHLAILLILIAISLERRLGEQEFVRAFDFMMKVAEKVGSAAETAGLNRQRLMPELMPLSPERKNGLVGIALALLWRCITGCG